MAYKDREKALAYWKIYNANRRPVRQKTPREIAIEKGDDRYYTGKPCVNGHLAERKTNDRVCVACINLLAARKRLNNPERIKVTAKKTYEKNKEKILEQKKEYRQANKSKITALNTLRKKRIKERVPSWVDDEEKWLIKEAYILAELRTIKHGFEWHVDHIIPLQGKLVSGLHVPSNLQVIPWVDNLRKKNKYEVA